MNVHRRFAKAYLRTGGVCREVFVKGMPLARHYRDLSYERTYILFGSIPIINIGIYSRYSFPGDTL